MTDLTFTLTPKEKISKAKLELYKRSPFFSYLIEYLKFIERKDIKTCSIDNKRVFSYNPDFISKLSTEEVLTILCHEVMHLALEHYKRQRNRNKMILTSEGQIVFVWNIACDIVINNILIKNGFKFPKNSIIPSGDSIVIFEKKITSISKKSAEEIYDELVEELDKNFEEIEIIIKDPDKLGEKVGEKFKLKAYKINEDIKNFDEHKWDIDKESKENKEDIDWKKILAEAYNYAKQRGEIPLGLKREYEILNKSKINWRILLRREISKIVPTDFTWSKPNKKYIWMDIYTPGIQKESVEVLIAIDTSSSVTKKELSQFISEIISIAKSFESIKLRIITHDARVYEDILIKDKDLNKLKKLKIRGGGGTDHRPLYKYIKEKKYYKNTKLLISFTDGYSEFPKKPIIPTIFILAGNHVAKSRMPKWAIAVISCNRD